MSVRPIVVGVDSSAASDAALDFAIADAAATVRPVRAVTAWWVGPALPEEHGARREERHQKAEQIQAGAVDRALQRADRRVEVESVVTHGPPGDVLIRHARDAYALVLGTGRKGHAKRALGGSTSTDCVRGCRCPVIVVPQPAGQGASNGDGGADSSERTTTTH